MYLQSLFVIFLFLGGQKTFVVIKTTWRLKPTDYTVDFKNLHPVFIRCWWFFTCLPVCVQPVIQLLYVQCAPAAERKANQLTQFTSVTRNQHCLRSQLYLFYSVIIFLCITGVSVATQKDTIIVYSSDLILSILPEQHQRITCSER